ncbi:DNA topoisomerase I [Candidatus Pacearchaeota archaeon]|nr:DNA topoisomerase I [Candidatus Pacearchaeota archaeon]
MQKKISKEEKIAENYFPMDKEIKRSVEVPVKEAPTTQRAIAKSTVEKIYRKPLRESLETVEKVSKKKRVRKKSKKRTVTKNVKYSPPEIELKENGYELIITEKPQAALKISNALGNAVQKNFNKIPYYEVDRDGEKIIVACAVGHLFTLKQNVPGSNVPIFDISWVPNFIAKKKDFTKRYHDTLLKLAKNAGSLTVATDYDIEGEVIGLNVVRFICGQKNANRMKFSTLTPIELNIAYEEKKPSINWGQAIAGETRHYLDWFYGINLSRALMNAIKSTGKFRIMSIGRIQGPALNLIVQKEKEIKKFVSQPFWQVFITADSKNKLELKYNKNIFDESELEKFKDLKGKKAQAETKKTEQVLPPNPPFNLTTLQLEAYKFHGITPSNTLKSAQSLYLAGLISYPRTSSQKLPSSIGYKKILETLAVRYKVTKLITKNKPIEGKKSDPAHPSIYPTGNKQILSGQDEKIYNLIVRRFLSLFCDSAIIDKKSISAKVDNLMFKANGSSVRKKAWMEIYPSKLKESEIPDLDGEVQIVDLKTEQKETQPPKRYSPASILSELEKRNLGTKATRAAILETLFDRGYVKNKSIEATPLGISLIDTLEKYSPIIIDQALTKTLEQKMDSIVKSTKDYTKTEQKVVDMAKKAIIKISKDFDKNEKEIGQELLTANLKQREQQKQENKLNICPVCNKGNLAITYSKKTRRHFIACDAYPDCKTTYSLPPKGTIKKTGKLCEKCGFPMLMSVTYNRKPWFFCFNKECETNKERMEKYRAKMEQEKEGE